MFRDYLSDWTGKEALRSSRSVSHRVGYNLPKVTQLAALVPPRRPHLGMHLELGYSWAAVGDALPQFGKMRQAPLERLTPHGGHPLRILESGHWTTLDKSLYLSEL